MSSVQPWLTKKEMMKDIARVTGRRVARLGDIDDSCIVIGDRPPPVKLEVDENEILTQFGVDRQEIASGCPSVPPPDLQGITKLIRMVQAGEGDHNSFDRPQNEISNGVIAISKGSSRLNPHVKEFVPKSALSPTVEMNKEAEIQSNTKKPPEDIENVAPVPNVNEELANSLKNKISDACKSDSFEIKKQKNVAIATLLRLYANNNQTSKTQPVKLITPEYYENPSPTDNVAATTTSTTSSPDRASTSADPASTSPDISKTSPDITTTSPEPTTTSPDISKTSPYPTSISHCSDDTEADIEPAIKVSIKKVNMWMNEPAKNVGKKATLYLNPVSFKCKEVQQSQTPTASLTSSQSEADVQDISPVERIPQAQQYKPSNYATTLTQKYMERNKKKERQKSANLWENLEIALKEQDKKILKKRSEQSAIDSDVSTMANSH